MKFCKSGDDNQAPILLFKQIKGTNTKLFFINSPHLNDLKLLKEVYGVNLVVTSVSRKDQEEILYDR